METLIEKYFDRTITEEEAATLLEGLRESPELRERFEREQDTDFLIRCGKVLAKSCVRSQESFHAVSFRNELDDSSPIAFDELIRLALEAPTLSRPEIEHAIDCREEEAIQKKYDIMPLKPLSLKERWRSAVLFMIVLVMISMAVYLEFHPISSGAASNFIALAEITESIEAVWENGLEYKKGRELGLEKLNLLEGVVQLRMKNNVEIVLEGPTEFVIRGPDETFCRFGKISATVPPEGKGFKIVTPVATIVDLGTEFSLSVDDEKIDVHVVKGVVDVARSGTDRLQLTTGLAAMLDFNGAMRQYETDLSSFFSGKAVRKLWNEYTQRRRVVWEEEDRRRSEDPSLLVSLADVRVKGCRKVEGSQSDRTAFHFQTPRDYLGVSMPGTHNDLTLTAFVRIAEMKNYTNTICLGFDYLDSNGEFFWQLSDTGVLRFHLQNNGIDRFDSEVVFGRRDWNTWVHLAVVADAKNKRIRHYLDGRLVTTLPWNNPLPLKMRYGAIGNAPPRQQTRVGRFLTGDIESFYAFSRALSDAEIAEMYENIR